MYDKKTQQSLKDFFKSGHISCLEQLEKKEFSKAELQCILALHLFGPLVPDAVVAVDNHGYGSNKKAKCPICSKSVAKKDTSFGNVRVWHGRADIMVGKTNVTVEKKKDEVGDFDGDDDEQDREEWGGEGEAGKSDQGSAVDQEDSPKQGDGEPRCKRVKLEPRYLAKKTRLYSDEEKQPFYEVKLPSTDTYMPLGPFSLCSEENNKFRLNSTLSQVLGQTIVNAFLQVKKNPSLANHFIPCFLASNKHITIHLYNCQEDVLLTQDHALHIWGKKSIKPLTVFSIWMALNLDKFDPTPLKAYGESVKKCKFQEKVGELLQVYEEELEQPLTGNDKEPELVLTYECLAPQDFKYKALLRGRLRF